jgi:hypothetical protein
LKTFIGANLLQYIKKLPACKIVSSKRFTPSKSHRNGHKQVNSSAGILIFPTGINFELFAIEMLKRDFLLKQMEEFARVMNKIISEILRLKNEGKTDEAYALAKDSLIEKFELDMENILALTIDDFRKVVVENTTSNPVQLNYLAELLYTTAELLKEKEEHHKADDLFRKSLMLYEYLNKTERTYSPERQEKIANITRQIQK